ncbi:MAG: TolB family protein [Chloroflexota bacterium]
MMSSDGLDRQLPVLLDELASPRVPDYFDDILGLTARTRQRPAWVFPKRWLPMLEIARQPVVAQPPWRALGLLLLLLSIVAAGVFFAATRPKPPPPFGPAGNGLIVMSRDGDIYTADTRTGAATAVVTGPEIDSDPLWSQDGTTLLFRRASEDQPGADFLMVARANGSGLKQLTPEPMTGLTAAKVWWYWAPKLLYALSPDGRNIGFISTVNGIPELFVGDTDGHLITKLDIGAMPMSFAFDPVGQRLLVVGAQGFDGSYSGLYLIDLDGTNRRTIVEPTLDAQVHSRIAWSPDGSRIAYARFEPGFVAGDRGGEAARSDLRIHIRATDGTRDIMIGEEDGPWWEAPKEWSPDGHHLLIERSIGDTYGAAIMDIDGHGPDVVPPFRSLEDWFEAWSPDGTMILVTPGIVATAEKSGADGLQQQLWDARTGEARTAPWDAASYPSWQRVGPP